MINLGSSDNIVPISERRVGGMVIKLADNRDPNSLASRMRSKRNQQFRRAISHLPRPLSILDVGGTQAVWQTIGFVDRSDILVTLLNVDHQETSYSNVESVCGDARDMHQFRDGQFDVVYSNSVIEHVGGIEDMYRMAREIQRVGKRYFIQTPNRYFPMEPHFVFPMFQFLPWSWQVYLVQNFNLGWIGRLPEREKAEQTIRSINLLSKNQLRHLFQDANITTENFLGLTKSLLAYKI
jgi:2-polyprenyl-3-methyl-5-hydroxy-6-metoxy-1,4-benzoquinol methylase